jgi:hypothetical protein
MRALPTPLRTESVETLRDFTELIENLVADKQPAWFRGVGVTSHRLVPSLYRHPTITDVEQLIALERKLIQRFRERSIPYQASPHVMRDDWDLLFLMQHFGVPTRLLDWTESPYIGLFFALTSAPLDPASQLPADAAAVWVLRPVAWNNHALSDIGFDEGILSVGAKPLEPWTPGPDTDYMRVFPVAMYGLHNSPRIVAQRGVFTIFGKATDAFDEVHQAGGYPSDTLLKIEVSATAILALLEQLIAVGITDSMIYPDLEGLARELKRLYGFRA